MKNTVGQQTKNVFGNIISIIFSHRHCSFIRSINSGCFHFELRAGHLSKLMNVSRQNKVDHLVLANLDGITTALTFDFTKAG